MSEIRHNLSDDCKLAYYLPQQAFYADALFRSGSMEIKPHVMVQSAAREGGGVEWEFQVTEYFFGNGGVNPSSSVRLQMFEDAFKAFEQIPVFFARMTSDRPKTLEAVLNLLKELGAEDQTERAEPRTYA